MNWQNHVHVNITHNRYKLCNLRHFSTNINVQRTQLPWLLPAATLCNEKLKFTMLLKVYANSLGQYRPYCLIFLGLLQSICPNTAWLLFGLSIRRLKGITLSNHSKLCFWLLTVESLTKVAFIYRFWIWRYFRLPVCFLTRTCLKINLLQPNTIHFRWVPIIINCLKHQINFWAVSGHLIYVIAYWLRKNPDFTISPRTASLLIHWPVFTRAHWSRWVGSTAINTRH